jgi:hypothetical protein
MKWKGYGRKRQWLTLSHYLCIRLEGLKKPLKSQSELSVLLPRFELSWEGCWGCSHVFLCYLGVSLDDMQKHTDLSENPSAYLDSTRNRECRVKAIYAQQSLGKYMNIFAVSAIGIATVRVQFPAWQDFSPLHSVQTDSGSHPASYPMGTGERFPRG